MAGRAIITGGASGLGAALSARAARAGLHVVVADIDTVGAHRVAGEIAAAGGSAEARRLDVTDEAAVTGLVEDVAAAGPLALMWNNAGVSYGGLALHIPVDEWRRAMDINFGGALHGTLAALRVMQRQGRGHIVNTASATGLTPQPGSAAYSSSKHAIIGMSRALRFEAEPHGVRVTAVCPGPIRTAMTEDLRIGGVDGDRVKEALPSFVWMSAEDAAERAWRGVSANKELVVFPAPMVAGWYLDRFAPALVRPVWRGMVSAMGKLLDA